MKRINTYYIWPRDLDFSFKLPTLIEFTHLRGYTESDFESHRVIFDRCETVATRDFNELVSLIRKRPRFQSLSIKLDLLNENQKKISFELRFSELRFEIEIDAEDDDVVVAMHNSIRDEFGLRNPTVPINESGRPKHLHATVFIGRHFDERGNEVGSLVRRFVYLLRFDVSEADEYRAMQIPEKVKLLIKRPDIYLGIVTGNREHGWIVAESSYAAGLGKHIILLVEEGLEFNPTFQGHDFEQIRFPKGHVEKAFIKLLSEFRSLGILGL